MGGGGEGKVCPVCAIPFLLQRDLQEALEGQGHKALTRHQSEPGVSQWGL